jgi:hypothetical protein
MHPIAVTVIRRTRGFGIPKGAGKPDMLPEAYRGATQLNYELLTFTRRSTHLHARYVGFSAHPLRYGVDVEMPI